MGNRCVGCLAVYECNDGHRIIGNRTRICQQNGTWSGNRPICQGKRYAILELCSILKVNCVDTKCDILVATGNGNVTTEIANLSAIATYSCRSGYDLKGGDRTRVCLPSGLWRGTQPSCKRIYENYIANMSFMLIDLKRIYL